MSDNKILLVDDDVFMRMGLSLYLNQQGYSVIEVGNAQAAWDLAQTNELTAAIIDIEVPEALHEEKDNHRYGNIGIQLAIRLKQINPLLGVVLFSAHEDRGKDVFALVHQGVHGIGYQLKGCRPSKLLRALDGVIKGKVMIDAGVTQLRRAATELLEKLQPVERYWVEHAASSLTQLTTREMEVAQYIATGHTIQGIADDMCVSSKTAENYIGRIYRKLDLTRMQTDAPHLRKVTILSRAFLVFDLSGANEVDE